MSPTGRVWIRLLRKIINWLLHHTALDECRHVSCSETWGRRDVSQIARRRRWDIRDLVRFLCLGYGLDDLNFLLYLRHLFFFLEPILSNLLLLLLSEVPLLIGRVGEDHTSKGVLRVLRRTNNEREFDERISAEVLFLLRHCLSLLFDLRLRLVRVFVAFITLAVLGDFMDRQLEGKLDLICLVVQGNFGLSLL